MNESPTVSVALVAYNHERFVAQAIESVLMQQTNFDVEIVVGEDCSTDRTRELVIALQKRYPDKIRLLLHAENQGASRNVVATFEACRGKYVATLDGDDYWTSRNKLQRQVDAMEANPDWVVCSHKVLKTYEGGSHVIPVVDPKRESTLADILKKNFASSCANLFRRSVFDGFPEDYHQEVAGDWFLLMLFARHGLVGFLPEVMAAYRIHSAGLYGGRTDSMRTQLQIQTLEAMLPFLDAEHKWVARASMADRRLHLGRYLREAGETVQAMGQLTRSYLQHPLHWRAFSSHRVCTTALLLTPGFLLRYIRSSGGGVAMVTSWRRLLSPR